MVLAFLLAPAGAGADPHAVQIDEVMAGAFGRLDLQLVELRLNGCHDDWGDGARLAFFDGAGNPVGTSAFPADTPLFCSSVLIATQAYADLPDVADPDFLMPHSLVPGSGKVCFQNPGAAPPVHLCLSYGNFLGDSEQGSPGNAPALVPTRTCSLRRLTLFDSFGNPNFNEDFGLGFPSPRGTSLNIPPRFSDVPRMSPFALAIEALFNAGVTGGCGNGAFCPGQAVTREQMAVLLLRSLEGPGFLPPACASPAFGDVPCSSPFAPWINELAARGITGGCGGGNFCPGVPVSRDQMAVFLLLALEGTGFTPPACTSPVFGDVPCSSPFAPWINELAARGITGGCGGGNFCPGSPVTREQMAAFLTFAFDLPVPSFDCSDGPPDEEGEDDHGDTLTAATPVLPGIPAAGVLETSEDRDVFSFQAQEGELFVVEAPIPGRPNGAPLTIVDA
ncbi:MAG TPA: S-layer homology domain-containing protein, partial [Thermoanaerobaculia bacterium]|nr:S-layer homology domain-containing protein [Thermoanaerobaculia bacterium]